MKYVYRCSKCGYDQYFDWSYEPITSVCDCCGNGFHLSDFYVALVTDVGVVPSSNVNVAAVVDPSSFLIE